MSIEKFSTASNEEVYGPAMAALFNNIHASDIHSLLEKHNISKADLKDWISLQRIMALYEDMDNREDISRNYVALGIQTIDEIPYPPGTDTVEKALKALEAAYQKSHRNHRPNEGTKIIFKSPQQAVIVFNAPYPDDIMFGYVWGTIRRFLPVDARFSVRYVEPYEAGVTDPGTVMLAEW